MAAVTDILQTVIRLEGAPQYAAEMGTAAVATAGFAAAEGVATAATGTLAASVGVLEAVLLPIIAPLLTLTAVIGGLSKAVNTFAEDQQQIFQTAVVLRNMGTSMPIGELQQFAKELQKIVPIDDEAIVSLGGLLAQFRLSGDQIKSVLPAIVDTAAATGESLETIGETVGRSLLGQARGLKSLGIQFKATGDRARDLKTIQEELSKRFGGAGAAQRNTVQGAFTALSEATSNFFSAVGRFLAPVIVPLLNKLTDFLTFLTEKIEALSERFPSFFKATDQTTGAESVGGNAEQTRYLKEIARNTGDKTDELIRAVLGGPGAIAKGAATARDFRIAFGV
jgi:hypothetical protein